MKNILVTGADGFIGSHLCEELLKQNKEVICVDNLVNCDKNNIKDFLNNPNFTFIEEDIRYLDQEKYKKHFENLDVIFHEACGK